MLDAFEVTFEAGVPACDVSPQQRIVMPLELKQACVLAEGLLYRKQFLEAAAAVVFFFRLYHDEGVIPFLGIFRPRPS